MEERHDVVIVGGGLVGSSLALALDRAGIAATLVEARPAQIALTDPERERYLALAGASVHALTALGVQAELEPHSAPIRAVHVSRRGDFGRVKLRASEYGFHQFGVVVPASRLGAALESALTRCRHLRRLAPARVLDVQLGPDEVVVRIEDEQGQRPLSCRLLVGADGADSFVRERAGMAVQRQSYDQRALVLSVGLSRDHDGVARERFTDDGAIALLPLPERRAGLVWTMPSARAEAIAALPPPSLLAALQETLGQPVGRLHSPGHLIHYPLARSFAPEPVRGRVVLVGNAAQTLHPIAAQGFNLGLRDALVLAEEWAGCTGEHDDALFATLCSYGERRRSERERIARLSHTLARWPKLNVPGLGLLRSLAMAGLNALPSARQSLVLTAMGFADDAPALSLERAS